LAFFGPTQWFLVPLFVWLNLLNWLFIFEFSYFCISYSTFTGKDGNLYRGEWKNGKKHGQGAEIHPNGTIRYEGQWIDGALTLSVVRGRALFDGVYTGFVLCSTGMPHGVGHIMYADKESYEGDWYVLRVCDC
jgi:hypothetical protein